jgi:hypothetical protein
MAITKDSACAALFVISVVVFTMAKGYESEYLHPGILDARPAHGIQKGNNLIKIGIVCAGSGMILMGVGVYDVVNTPSEVFPVFGVTCGIIGLASITFSVPITTSGIIVRAVSNRRRARLSGRSTRRGIL